MLRHYRSFVFATVLAALVAPGAARAQTGPFVNAQPPFFGSFGASGVLRVGTTQINVDTNKDGVPDTTFNLPPSIQGMAIEDRLSPTESVLYTRQSTNDPSCVNRVSFHRLAAPPNMTPLADGVCLRAPLAFGPLFFDPSVSAPIRTALIVTQTVPATTFRQQIIWVDLVNGAHNSDEGTHEANVEQTAIGVQFAPAGNAALVRHATSTPSPKYSLIDLCRSRVAGAGSVTTQDLPAGTVTAHVVADAGGSLLAQLRVDGSPVPGSGVPLDNCLGAASVFLELGKSAPVTVQSENPFDYEITVKNTGSEAAHDVTLEDVIPSATTFVSATLGGHFGANGVVRWEIGTLPAGAEQHVVLTVRPSCPQFRTILNDQYAARSTETGVLNGLPVPSICIPPPAVQMSIAKSGPATVRQGDLYTYTLQYANTGTQTANGVVIEDVLSPGIVFVSASGNGTQSGSTVRWNIGSVASNGGGSVTLTVRAGCVPQLVNSQYSIRSSGTGAVQGPSVVTNVIPASTAPIDVTVASVPITRAPPLQRGDLVQHVITLRNTVAEARNGLLIQLSAGRAARFDQILDAGGGTVTLTNPQTLVWSGSIGPSATVTIIVTSRLEECLGPTDTFTQLNDGRPVQVVDVCNRVLGSQSPPAPFPVQPPIVATLKILGPGTPQSGLPVIDGLIQAVRAGSTIDLQMSIVNQSPNAEPAAVFSMVLPPELTPVGAPPFVAPTDPAAVYDDLTRTVSWNGSLDAGETVLVTIRAQLPLTGACSVRISFSASAGTCQQLGTNLTLLSVPEEASDKYLVGTDHRLGLWRFRPGIDPTFADLLCFPGEIFTGMDRAANGDIWVTGLPTYRVNPATLDLQVVERSTLSPPGFKFAADVAVDPTAANPSPIFLVPDAQNRSRLVRFEPTSGLTTIVRDALPPMERIVIDRLGRIAGVNGRLDQATGTPAGVILVDPANPANDRVLSDPAFPSLDFNLLDADLDGTFVVAVPFDPASAFGSQTLVRVDPGPAGPGTFSVIAADLASLIPPPAFGQPTFHSLAIGGATDIYLGRQSTGSLGVLHQSGSPSGETLVVGRNVIDLEYIDPSAPPPPPPGPVSIDVEETILVADAADVLTAVVLAIDEQIVVDDALDVTPGLVIHVDEQIVVDDTPAVLPGVVINIEEAVTIADAVTVLPAVLLSIDEPIAIDDETELTTGNTPAGRDVLVLLRDPLTLRTVATVRFPIVTRIGMTAFTRLTDGPLPPAGFVSGDPPIVYDLTTTAAFGGPLTVCLNPSEQRFLRLPRLFHFEGAAWFERTSAFDGSTGFVCGIVPTLSPFALFELSDRTAPVTTVTRSPGPNGSGWNTTDVVLVVKASDEPAGSGVKHVHLSLSGAQTGMLLDPAAPIVITAEGTTTATFFAEDHAGNVEPARSLVVRIDRTPPEIEVRFDPAALDVLVFGTDGLSGVPSGAVHPTFTPLLPFWQHETVLRRYDVADLAGNRLDVLMRQERNGKHERPPDDRRLTAAIVAIRYDGEPWRQTASNELEFKWTIDKRGGLTALTQEMSLDSQGRRRIVEARFDAKRGITTIREGKRHAVERQGLVLLRLTTARGELSIRY